MATTIGKMKYGWSRWGGGFYGLVKDEQDWFCQSCGKPQPKEMPQYMIPTDEECRDYIRICSVCKHLQISHKIRSIHIYRLFKMVRVL